MFRFDIAGRCSLVLVLLGLGVASASGVPPVAAAQDAPRILHVMSYHSPWRWTDGQLEGFKDGLGLASAQYEMFQMDTKHNSAPQQKAQMGEKARALIEQWQPDLLYTSDDDAQQFVARHYLDTRLPLVFSGVNNSPASYGFDSAHNVSGVLEQEHFVESVRLLRSIDPTIRRIAVVFDDAAMWHPVRKRMEKALLQLPGVEFGPWDTVSTFEEYRSRMLAYQQSVDAVALLGIFNFKGEDGKNVPYQEVLRWTAENSRLPDFSYWVDRVHYGTLCAVTVSEREQGLAAGGIARRILVDGVSPDTLPMRPTHKGLPVVSLARARALGIPIPSSVLLSSEVITEFEWQH